MQQARSAILTAIVSLLPPRHLQQCQHRETDTRMLPDQQKNWQTTESNTHLNDPSHLWTEGRTRSAGYSHIVSFTLCNAFSCTSL